MKTYKAVTSSRRWMEGYDFSDITKERPEKNLTMRLRRTGGRNNQGSVTSRWRGGGAKRQYRIIDFRRDKFNIPAKVIAIEYDPNRTCRLALLLYKDGERRYVIAPNGLKIDTEIISGDKAEIEVGNNLYLRAIPLGMPIHNIELYKGKGGQLVRAAGGSAVIMAKEGKYAHVKLPSGEIRLIPLDCMATIGQIGNVEHGAISLGKAGRSRWLGRNPRVRGVAMNPVDHPMGGGEGKSSGGRHPCSPWGLPAKGYMTRQKKKSAKFILKPRKERTAA